jgi:hypothetical protein
MDEKQANVLQNVQEAPHVMSALIDGNGEQDCKSLEGNILKSQY